MLAHTRRHPTEKVENPPSNEDAFISAEQFFKDAFGKSGRSKGWFIAQMST